MSKQNWTCVPVNVIVKVRKLIKNVKMKVDGREPGAACLPEMRIKVEKGLGGAEMRNAGVDTGGVVKIINIRIIVKRHTLSKALGERRQHYSGVEPQPEPSVVRGLLKRDCTQQAGRPVVAA